MKGAVIKIPAMSPRIARLATCEVISAVIIPFVQNGNATQRQSIEAKRRTGRGYCSVANRSIKIQVPKQELSVNGWQFARKLASRCDLFRVQPGLLVSSWNCGWSNRYRCSNRVPRQTLVQSKGSKDRKAALRQSERFRIFRARSVAYLAMHLIMLGTWRG